MNCYSQPRRLLKCCRLAARSGRISPTADQRKRGRRPHTSRAAGSCPPRSAGVHMARRAYSGSARRSSQPEGGRVASATLSSWESTTNPKTPPAARISTYARFFSTPRSMEGGTPPRTRRRTTQPSWSGSVNSKHELSDLAGANPKPDIRSSSKPDRDRDLPDGACLGTEPTGEGAGSELHKMHQYGDLDALIDLYGHLRAENPTLDVFHRLTSDVVSDDLTSHVVLLGGVGWNKVTRRFQEPSSGPDYPGGSGRLDDRRHLQVATADGDDFHYPEYEDLGDGSELIADVGYLARLRQPVQGQPYAHDLQWNPQPRGIRRSTLPDRSRVRDENERYIADQFPGGEFAILLRVPVVTNETLSPDLQDPDSHTRVGAQPGSGGERSATAQRWSHAHLPTDVSRCPRRR